MHGETTTRRSFVVGAAGVALAGSFAFLAGREHTVETAASDGITVVRGDAGTPVLPAVANLDAIGVTVGQPIRVNGEAGAARGSILSITPSQRRSWHPAGVRDQPFIVHLAMDPAGAPLGDRIYALSTPLAGLNEVFLTRGADMGGKAILMAVFN